MHRLLQLVKSEAYMAFCFQALVYDKLIPIRRPAGIHIYDNKLALEGIEHIPGKGESLRPESYMTSSMAEEGHKTLQTPFLIGLHDFEQSYKDLFKKSMLHSNKHSDVLRACEAFWHEQKDTDPDYAMVLDGCMAGKLLNEQIRIDKNFWKERTAAYLEMIGIDEKPELEISQQKIDKLKRQFEQRKILKSVQRYKNPDHRDIYFRFENHSGRRQGHLKELLRKLGIKLYYNGLKLKNKA
jgi:hypothetical protein